MQWLELNTEGKLKPVTKVEMIEAQIDSQLPAGSVSINEQKSGWIAKTANGKMFDELHHEWSLVPKDMIVDLRLLMHNSNITIPKIPSFDSFVRIKGGDGRYNGVGATIKNTDNIMYVLALNKSDGAIIAIDSLKMVEVLNPVSKLEIISFDSVEENNIEAELPTSMLVIPRRSMDNYFFQYKDGAFRTGVPHQLYGQVAGMTVNKIGNCICLYYDQPYDKCLVSIDNIFAMKVSLTAQGFPAGVFQNPMTGEVV
jgi:hypothetical protein